MEKFEYNVSDFDFTSILQNIFNVDNLANVHTVLEKELDVPDDPSKDQSTFFHKKFYGTFDDDTHGFLDLYKKFVTYLAETHFSNQTMIYQKRPTFRVQVPNNIAVAKWHKDKAYNHSAFERNIFLPFTNAFGNNTIWAESEEDKQDFAPMEAKYGEYYLWDGANLNHGNKKNDTGVSRVSVDFRLISEENFDYEGTSVTTKVPMKLGHYWEKI